MTHQYMEIKIKELEKRIEALEQELKTGRWIPISERLPNLNDFSGSRVWQKEVLITGYLSFDDKKNYLFQKLLHQMLYTIVYLILLLQHGCPCPNHIIFRRAAKLKI